MVSQNSSSRDEPFSSPVHSKQKISSAFASPDARGQAHVTDPDGIEFGIVVHTDQESKQYSASATDSAKVNAHFPGLETKTRCTNS